MPLATKSATIFSLTDMMLLSGNQNYFWRRRCDRYGYRQRRLALSVKGRVSTQSSDPSSPANIAAPVSRKVLGCVGIGSNKGDLLQGHAAHINAPLARAQDRYERSRHRALPTHRPTPVSLANPTPSITKSALLGAGACTSLPSAGLKTGNTYAEFLAGEGSLQSL